jgi:hypothetical protein
MKNSLNFISLANSMHHHLMYIFYCRCNFIITKEFWEKIKYKTRLIERWKFQRIKVNNRNERKKLNWMYWSNAMKHQQWMLCCRAFSLIWISFVKFSLICIKFAYKLLLLLRNLIYFLSQFWLWININVMSHRKIQIEGVKQTKSRNNDKII